MTEEHHAEFDVSQITEYIFLGTNLCCLTKSHIQILHDAGIDAEIDLEKERQDSMPGVPVYLWLPVPDKTAPSVEQFDAGVALMSRMVSGEKRIYIHCQYGHGRSPTMVAAYFISLGKTVDEAIEEITKARPEIHIEDVQRKALMEYSDRVNK
jgi:protein-tyrosine phosphatase